MKKKNEKVNHDDSCQVGIMGACLPPMLTQASNKKEQYVYARIQQTNKT